MEIFNGPILSTLLALAATFLGLAVLVQVLQEIYKYLTSSKYRSYTKVLTDFLGPWVNQLLTPGPFLDLQVSGPFQIRRLSPKGILLPMDRESLAGALERTAPHWIRKTVDQLKLECRLQGDKETAPSPEWKNFLAELGELEKGAPGYWNAQEIAQFLSVWKHGFSTRKESVKIGEIIAPETIKAADILASFRRKFLSHIDNVNENFSQLEKNFEYSYRRRNLRQTFIIAMVLAVIFNLTFERIYHAAGKIPPEQAITLAENAISYYEARAEKSTEQDTVNVEQQLVLAQNILQSSLESLSDEKRLADYFVNKEDILDISKSSIISILRFLFGCIMTAILVSFGAPFWNDIVKAILRIKQPRRTGAAETEKG
jgi:hypothetical protein